MDYIYKESEPIISTSNSLISMNNSELEEDKVSEYNISQRNNQEKNTDNDNKSNFNMQHEPEKIVDKNLTLNTKENIKRNLNFDNPLGLFEDESCDAALSQKEKDVDDEDLFFIYEDESQDATNGDDSNIIDMDCSKAEISESSNLETPLCDSSQKGVCSWRGKRKLRGSKVPASVINRKYKKKVGDALANNEKEKITSNYQLFEYYWPPGKSGELCMIQEAVCEYLSLVSFKRKYPELNRRPIDVKEREFLKELFLVTDSQCDLGLTVLLADEVYDLMEEDFSHLYQEYLKKPRRRYRYVEKSVDPVQAEKLRKENILKRAIESASSYNSKLLKDKKAERQTYLDLQTFTIHVKRKRQKVGINPYENLTNFFPVALVPGQFQQFYKQYSSNELNYLPLNTALFTTHKKLMTNPDDYEDSDPEDSVPLIPQPIAINNLRIDGQEQIDKDQKIISDSTPVTSNDSDLKIEKNSFSIKHMKDTEEIISAPEKDIDLKELKDTVDEAVEDIEESEMKETTPKKRKYSKRSTQKVCSFCGQLEFNKKKEADDLIRCSTCRLYNHPGCLELSSIMIPWIRKYPWQCMDCKVCCQCKEPHDEDKMMFCDMCDRGYHTYCVGLETIPEGQWKCSTCSNQNPKPKRGRPCKIRPLISTVPSNELVNDSNESLIVNTSQSEVTSLHEQINDLIKMNNSTSNQSENCSIQIDEEQNSSFKTHQSTEESDANSSIQIEQLQDISKIDDIDKSNIENCLVENKSFNENQLLNLDSKEPSN